MDAASDEALPPIVTANDKLLKALISLLALRDPDLLDDLRTVFAVAQKDGNAIGVAADPTWAHVRAELRIITDLVESEEDDDLSEEALGNAPNAGPAKLI